MKDFVKCAVKFLMSFCLCIYWFFMILTFISIMLSPDYFLATSIQCFAWIMLNIILSASIYFALYVKE